MTLKEYAALVERTLEGFFLPEEGLMPFRSPALLSEAMRYSLLAGGKRLRPSMLLAAVDMLGGDREAALIPAAAVEMIHTYSLIHDDLPGMDDDTLRRGRPTNHVMYGVGQAVLAGDGLLNCAHELLLENALRHPEALENHLRAAYEISVHAGVRGMVGGQCVDLQCERGAVAGDEAALEYIHYGKTACMFVGPLRAAARLCGADAQTLDALTNYARAFGLLFQAVDDLLDVESDAATLGKSVGKDARDGKLTCISLMGVKGTHARCERLLQEGLEALLPLGERAAFFRTLIGDMAYRKA